MTDFTAARRHMVDSQVKTAGVISPAILNAFETLPREKFVPSGLQDVAYTDEDLKIGGGRFLLEPVVHAKMVEAVAPKAGDVVLDIGGCTGYSAALFCGMVTTIFALEEERKYLDKAALLWNELVACNIVGVQGKLTKGCPDHAPYSLIFMNGAVSEIPEHIVDQLAPEGRLITIIKPPGAVLGQVTLVRSTGQGQYSTYNLFSAGTPYLPGFEPKPAFVF